MTDPRYPIGRFDPRAVPSAEELRAAVRDIAELPGRLAAALDGLTEAELDAPYRDGGWTVRQLVHHVADSHMNAFVRLRLALTEEAPEIRPYDQDAWCGLADSRTLPPAVSRRLPKHSTAKARQIRALLPPPRRSPRWAWPASTGHS